MRNRIKQLLNKEDGFTLVELLGVIVILGIIIAIAIPGIGRVVDDARDTTAGQQQELVLDAAQLYFLQNEETTVEVSKLISEGFIEDKDEFVNEFGGKTVTKSKEGSKTKLTIE